MNIGMETETIIAIRRIDREKKTKKYIFWRETLLELMSIPFNPSET